MEQSPGAGSSPQPSQRFRWPGRSPTLFGQYWTPNTSHRARLSSHTVAASRVAILPVFGFTASTHLPARAVFNCCGVSTWISPVAAFCRHISELSRRKKYSLLIRSTASSAVVLTKSSGSGLQVRSNETEWDVSGISSTSGVPRSSEFGASNCLISSSHHSFTSSAGVLDSTTLSLLCADARRFGVGTTAACLGQPKPLKEAIGFCLTILAGAVRSEEHTSELQSR